MGHVDSGSNARPELIYLEKDGHHHDDSINDMSLTGAPALLELLGREDDDHPDQPHEEGEAVEQPVRVEELRAVLDGLEVVRAQVRLSGFGVGVSSGWGVDVGFQIKAQPTYPSNPHPPTLPRPTHPPTLLEA